MLNKQLHSWFLCIAATLVAVCSCADNVQELTIYWEGHDFTSLDGFSNIKTAEEKFDGYVDLLCKVSYNDAVVNLRTFLDSASQNTVAYMVWSGWFEPYLHANLSPYKNDRLFTAWLDMVLEDKVIDDGGMMEHLHYLRGVMDKNQVGSTMEDVRLRDCNGDEFMLSEIIEKKSMILLVDANCPSCLSSLEENVHEYKDANLIAVLVEGGSYHIQNIRRQISEDILEKWTLVCGSKSRLEEAAYDTSNLPTRLLVSADGEIIKSYH